MKEEKKKPVIAVVIAGYTRVGGGERIAVELCRRLKNDFSIHVITRELGESEDGVTFHKLARINFPRSLKRLIFAWQVKRKLDVLKPDWIHTHERIFEADMVSLHGTPPAHWAKEVKGSHRLSLFDRSCAYLEERLFKSKRCKFLLPVSKLVLEAYQSYYDLSEKIVELLPPGVGEEYFNKVEPDEIENWREKLNTPENAKVLLFVSMNFKHKGLGTILEAMGKLKEDPCLHLWVVGRGDEKYFFQKARALGIEERLHFAGVVEEGLPSLYQAADVFVLPSRFDTFALVVLEAMASGLPVIISDKVGASYLIEEGVHGEVTLPLNPEDLVTKLKSVFVGERYIHMGGMARERAADFKWDRMAEKLSDLYCRGLELRG